MGRLPVLDAEALEQLRVLDKDDPGFFTRVLRDYLAQLDSSLSSMREAAVARDADRIRIVAHSLKGASSMVGALGVKAIAETLETAAMATNWSEIDRVLPGADGEVARLRTSLEAEFVKEA